MYDVIVERAKLLSCPTRLAVWQHIAELAAHPSDIARSMERSQSTIAYHLSILEQAGLVRHTRLGRYRIYEGTGTSWGIVTEAELAGGLV